MKDSVYFTFLFFELICSSYGSGITWTDNPQTHLLITDFLRVLKWLLIYKLKFCLIVLLMLASLFNNHFQLIICVESESSFKEKQ